MYKKLAFVTSIGLGLSCSVIASDDGGQQTYPIRKYEITADVLSDALERATLNDESQQKTLPSFNDYYTQTQTDYALALKDYIDLADKNAERHVTDILKPRTEIFLPCKGGLLRYKFFGTTSQINSVLQREIVEVFLQYKKAGITFHLFEPDFAKDAIITAFMRKHLPKLQEDYKLIYACKQALSLPGVKAIDFGGDKILIFGEEATDKIQSLAKNAAVYLSNAPDLDFGPDIMQTVFEALEHPLFVEAEISEKDTFAVTNVRGVTHN